MSSQFKISDHFINSWIACCATYAQKKYGVNIGESKAADADIHLANLLSRIPFKNPRIVKCAQGFSVPQNLINGWNLLKRKIENGEDLHPHLSRNVLNIKKSDGLLNDWGVNHFHLGEEQDEKNPNLIQGTEEILYAYVTNSEFYALTIDIHGKWCNKSLLELQDENWPETIRQCRRANATLTYNISENERKALRKNNINTPVSVNGEIMMSYGATMSGQNSFAVEEAIILRRRVFNLLYDKHLNITKGWEGTGHPPHIRLNTQDLNIYLYYPKRQGESFKVLSMPKVIESLHKEIHEVYSSVNN